MFSKSCEYGIRAVILICEKSRRNLILNVKEISAQANVPEQYLAKVLQQLSKQKVISSIKGPKGGFFMDEFQKGLTLIDLIKAIDGDSLFKDCSLGLRECNEKTPCPLHKYFKAIRNELREMLESTTLEQLSKDLKKGKTKLKDII